MCGCHAADETNISPPAEVCIQRKMFFEIRLIFRQQIGSFDRKALNGMCLIRANLFFTTGRLPPGALICIRYLHFNSIRLSVSQSSSQKRFHDRVCGRCRINKMINQQLVLARDFPQAAAGTCRKINFFL